MPLLTTTKRDDFDRIPSVAPILILIIAMWYKKNEQGRRVSWFYVCNVRPCGILRRTLADSIMQMYLGGSRQVLVVGERRADS